jgi:outer membrane protein OmpA-like peptidoglycan-associated protein
VHSSSVLRRLVGGAGALALLTGLAACAGSVGSSEPTERATPTDGLAIVVGAHSNMPPASLDGAAREALNEAVMAESYVALVVADGAPFVVPGDGPLVVDHSNSEREKRSRAENQRNVEQAIDSAAAKTAETDLLGALHLAGRSIADLPGERTIVVVDSGLSTVVPLDFTQPGLLDADPDELATSLEAAGELPDLAGATVVLQGIGDTAPPQQPLSHGQQESLRAIWMAIVDAAGGEVSKVEKPLSGDPVDDLPPVTPVPPSVPQCTAGTVTLTGADVAFQPNSATFVDQAAAEAVIRPIAQQLVDAGVLATVTGMTANVDGLEGQIKLSGERAEAVKALLVSEGVPADRLTVIGLGSNFPGYVQDHDAAGNLLPAEAAQNRKVVIDPEDVSTSLSCAPN